MFADCCNFLIDILTLKKVRYNSIEENIIFFSIENVIDNIYVVGMKYIFFSRVTPPITTSFYRHRMSDTTEDMNI